MPQLDIVYTLSIYLCTWLSMILLSKKISTFMLTTKLTTPTQKTPPITPISLWT